MEQGSIINFTRVQKSHPWSEESILLRPGSHSLVLMALQPTHGYLWNWAFHTISLRRPVRYSGCCPLYQHHLTPFPGPCITPWFSGIQSGPVSPGRVALLGSWHPGCQAGWGPAMSQPLFLGQRIGDALWGLCAVSVKSAGVPLSLFSVRRIELGIARFLSRCSTTWPIPQFLCFYLLFR
jgi:hypothetical protein